VDFVRRAYAELSAFLDAEAPGEQIGLDRAFIAAMPVGGPGMPRSRIPFPEEVARALADEVGADLTGPSLHRRSTGADHPCE
jgi:hypothetical protein